MRLYPNILEACVQAIEAIFAQNQAAEQQVEQLLRNRPKWGSRDRRFVADSIYSVVRNYRYYALLAGIAEEGKPTRAEAWLLLGRHLQLQGIELPPFEEWEQLGALDSGLVESLESSFAQRYSVPTWLAARLEAQIPSERWQGAWKAMHEEAHVILRCNRLKTNRSALVASLQAEGMQVELLGEEDALRLDKRRRLQLSSAYRDGLFELQDYNSQAIAPLLRLEPGLFVVDACAGAGGKTLHIGALMQNKGQILSMDIDAQKLKTLAYRATRAGLKIVQTRSLSRKIEKLDTLGLAADRLLLDVPCTGMGVLRRHPDSKWKLRPEHIEALKKTQQEILQNYSCLCKPGGFVLYVTCSILPEENEEQVQSFLASQAGEGFALVEERHLWPDATGYDGFYAALLERRG